MVKRRAIGFSCLSYLFSLASASWSACSGSSGMFRAITMVSSMPPLETPGAMAIRLTGPGWILESASARITMDSAGRTSTRKKPGEFRVLIVGDSVAFGLGVEEDAIFPSQLDRILRLRHPQRAILVMNAAVASYNTRTELESLKHLWHLEPDIIVLQYLVDNDSDLEPGIAVDPQTGRLAHPAAGRFLPAPVSLALNRHSRTYNFFRYHLARIAGAAESPAETREIRIDSPTTTPGGSKVSAPFS